MPGKGKQQSRAQGMMLHGKWGGRCSWILGCSWILVSGGSCGEELG